jgi:TPR repeat protein
MGLNSRCLSQLALILLLPPFISPPVLADYEAGLRAYERNNFSRARTEFFQSAIQGHAGAQFLLGEIYEGGVGVAVDYDSAIKWYRSAAEQDYAAAQRRLAYLYTQGLGADKNEAKAFTWYLRSANNGDVLGQLEVGLRYRQGLGTKKNPVEAYKWLTIAASYGDPDALAERGRLDGELTAADRQRALTLARDWEQRWESRNEAVVP